MGFVPIIFNLYKMFPFKQLQTLVNMFTLHTLDKEEAQIKGKRKSTKKLVTLDLAQVTRMVDWLKDAG